MEKDKKNAAKLNANWYRLQIGQERKEPPEFSNPPRTSSESKPLPRNTTNILGNIVSLIYEFFLKKRRFNECYLLSQFHEHFSVISMS